MFCYRCSWLPAVYTWLFSISVVTGIPDCPGCICDCLQSLSWPTFHTESGWCNSSSDSSLIYHHSFASLSFHVDCEALNVFIRIHALDIIPSVLTHWNKVYSVFLYSLRRNGYLSFRVDCEAHSIFIRIHVLYIIPSVFTHWTKVYSVFQYSMFCYAPIRRQCCILIDLHMSVSHNLCSQ